MVKPLIPSRRFRDPSFFALALLRHSSNPTISSTSAVKPGYVHDSPFDIYRISYLPFLIGLIIRKARMLSGRDFADIRRHFARYLSLITHAIIFIGSSARLRRAKRDTNARYLSDVEN